jgi:site-specific recombinase XerD
MTTTTISSAAVVPARPVLTDRERRALAGFLAGDTGLTREAYALDLRQFTAWCARHSLRLFDVRRAGIECFARDLEAAGRARATVTRRVCTIAGFCRYAVEEDLLGQSPAVHVRRPRLDYESHATGLDRNEIGAMLVAAGLGPPAEHALISLLALNGLRVSEAAGVEALGVERGHRTLAVRKGGKKVTIPLAPRTARAIDLAIGERCGPIFLTTAGARLDRHGAGRIVRRIARQAGIAKAVGPHTLRHASQRRWTPACRCATSGKQPPTRIPERRCGTTAPGSPWTATPPTSSRPTSPEPPGNATRQPDRPARHPPAGRHAVTEPTPPTVTKIRPATRRSALASRPLALGT